MRNLSSFQPVQDKVLTQDHSTYLDFYFIYTEAQVSAWTFPKLTQNLKPFCLKILASLSQASAPCRKISNTFNCVSVENMMPKWYFI